MVDDSVSNIRFTPDKGDDHRTKSVPRHKTKRDFKKVLARESREEREHSGGKEAIKEKETVKGKDDYEHVAREIEAQEGAAPKSKVSLFDLSASPAEEALIAEEEMMPTELPEALKKESLSALFKGYGSKEQLQLLQKKGEQGSRFSQEQPDLSAINPMASQPSGGTAAVQGTQQQPAAVKMQEIIDQIVKELYVASANGRTDTMVTLKHPPMFAGTNVIITSYNTAKGEFNITFENLTQAAKQLLDLQDNQNALKFGLAQKGYVVHILTTTTLTQTLAFVEGETPAREGKEEEGSPEQGQEQQKEKD